MICLFPPDAISGLRFDCGHAVLDSFLSLVEYIIATYPDQVANLPTIQTALVYLKDTPDLTLARPYGPLARNLVKLLGTRFRATPMEAIYGPSTPGLIHLLRLFEKDPTEVAGPLLPAIGTYISTVMTEAWEQTIRSPNDSTLPGFGPDPEQWLTFVPRTFKFSWGRDLLLPESIDPAFDQESNPIECDSASTVRSQISNTYTQVTAPGRPDLAETTFYPGPSDDPESPAFLSTLKKWEESEIAPALNSTPRLTAACARQSGCRTKKAVIITE